MLESTEPTSTGQLPAPDEVVKVRKCRGYTQIDNAVLRSGMSCRAIGLLLLMWSKPPGWRFSSVRIADEVTEGREAIRTAMRELIDAGFVRCDRVGTPPHTVFFVREDPHTPWPDEANVQVTPKDGFLGDGKLGDGKLGLSVSTERATPEVVNKPSAHPADEREGTQEPLFVDPPPPGPRFDDFWALYPRRVGKRKAEQAWNDALKRGKATTILAAAQTRVAWWAKARKSVNMIPYPATWLNRDGWADEIEPVPVDGKASLTQAQANFEVVQRTEVEQAVAAGDFDLAWKLTVAKAAATQTNRWWAEIAREIDSGRPDELTIYVVKRDGRKVTLDEVHQVRAAKAQLYRGVTALPADGAESQQPPSLNPGGPMPDMTVHNERTGRR